MKAGTGQGRFEILKLSGFLNLTRRGLERHGVSQVSFEEPENPKVDILGGYLNISSFLQNAIGSYICLELKICALQSALLTCYNSVNILLALHIWISWIV